MIIWEWRQISNIYKRYTLYNDGFVYWYSDRVFYLFISYGRNNSIWL